MFVLFDKATSKKNKEKLAVLMEHKKILKMEVIDTWAMLEEVKSELDVVSHQKIHLEGRFKREKSRRLGIQQNYQALREQLAVQERVWGMIQSNLKESRRSRGSWHSGKSLADEDDSESA